MTLRYAAVLCIVIALGCGDSKSAQTKADAQSQKPEDGSVSRPQDAAAPGKDSATSPGGDSGENEPQSAQLVPANSDAPQPDYAKIAEEACVMAGGSCDYAKQTAMSVPINSLACDPAKPQIFCVRPEGDCGIAKAARCCSFADDGRPKVSGATCDRGYPTCATFNNEWLAPADCSDRSTEIALPTEELSTRWQGAVSVLKATRWACAQAGGLSTPYGTTCDGTTLNFRKQGVETCCLPKAACPDAFVDTECCQSSGMVVEKGCSNGRAYCNDLFIGIGTMREVKTGTCAPFKPVVGGK